MLEADERATPTARYIHVLSLAYASATLMRQNWIGRGKTSLIISSS